MKKTELKLAATNCHGDAKDIKVVESEALLEFIAEGLHSEYEDPVHSVGWCSGDRGWLLPTMDSYELLEDLALGNFYDDAALAFSEHKWVECGPEQQQLWRWSQFCQYVKHDRRFFFHSSSEPEPNDSLVDILDYVGRVATEANMIATLGRGLSLYRARQHDVALHITTADVGELATPLADLAKTSNRMSPAGIPMFYAAMDEEAAYVETVTSSPKEAAISIGRFEVTGDLRILNLAEIPDVPSLFDSNARHLRTGLKFMQSFANDLSQPIERNGVEHINYVPTQIASEFFRLRFSDPSGQLRGLSFRSSKSDRGICVCLFLKHDDFVKRRSKLPLRLVEVVRRAVI